MLQIEIPYRLAIILGALALGAFLLWKFLYSFLFPLPQKLSHQTREEVYPDLNKAVSSITNLSAGAILLSFTILQYFGKKPLIAESYLITSWALFGFTVMFGAIASLGFAVFRLQHKTYLNQLEKLVKKVDQEQPVKESSKNEMRDSGEKSAKLEKFIFIVIYLHSIFFITAVLSFCIFASYNVGNTAT